MVPDLEKVKNLLEKGNEGNFLKCVQNMNYNNPQECDALVELLCNILKKMQNLENCSQEEVVVLVQEEKFLLRVMENILIRSNDENSELIRIMRHCIEQLSGGCAEGHREWNFKIFLLLESVIDGCDVTLEPDILEEILEHLGEEDRKELLQYLVFYLKCLNKLQDNKILSREYLLKLKDYTCGRRVLISEWEMAREKEDRCGWKMVNYLYRKKRLRQETGEVKNKEESQTESYDKLLDKIIKEELKWINEVNT